MEKKQTVENSEGKTFLEIDLHQEHNILYCRWIGLITEIESSKEACLLIISLIEKYKVKFLLNDNRDQKGPWPAINEWLGTVWIPGMVEAGLEKFAHIHSENVFTEMSAKRALQEEVIGLTIKHTKSYQSANEWLLESQMQST